MNGDEASNSARRRLALPRAPGVEPFARLLLVVLVGGAQLAKLTIEIEPIAEATTESIVPAPLPLHTVLSFVNRHSERVAREPVAAEEIHRG